MRKTFKYRLYPTKETERKLLWTLARCRELYNAALSERKDTYTYAGKSVSYYDQQLEPHEKASSPLVHLLLKRCSHTAIPQRVELFAKHTFVTPYTLAKGKVFQAGANVLSTFAMNL